jgi:hypothetical protein
MARIEWDRRARRMPCVAMTAAALFMTILGSTAFQSVIGGFEAAAQGAAGPSEDAPPLRAGQRVERPFGELEISSFTQVQKDQGTLFTVEFLIRNEGQNSLNLIIKDYLRLIADGVPRAPEYDNYDGCAGRCGVKVAGDSAEYARATFSVRGQPKQVYLQFGTRDEGRAYLRWPK